MIRPLWNGPRSLIFTLTDFPVRWSVTVTTEPKGSVRWAAVMAFWSNRSPDAVFLPWNPGPYQDAPPHCASAGPVAERTSPAIRAATQICLVNGYSLTHGLRTVGGLRAARDHNVNRK